MISISNKKGFSLIELLIVITIIGILSTIILNSLSVSRARAYDSKIKQQLTSFRTAAEVYFLNQTPNNYGYNANCDTTSSIFTDTIPANGSPRNFINPQNLPNNPTVICQTSTDGLSYAVKVPLYSSGYWCVDSKGASMATNNGNQTTICQ